MSIQVQIHTSQRAVLGLVAIQQHQHTARTAFFESCQLAVAGLAAIQKRQHASRTASMILKKSCHD